MRSGARGLCGRGDGLVEEVDERGGEGEVGGDGAGEGRVERGLGGEGGGDAPLSPAEVLVGGVVGGEAFGFAGEGIGVVEGESTPETAVFDEGLELLVMSEEVAADGEELFWGWHVESGGEDELGSAEVQVITCAGGFGHAGASPPCGDVLLVGGFVGGEADVAIDAEQDAVGGADVGGGVVGHGGGDGLDECEHGGFDFALEDGAAGLEPLAAVVASESPEEAERFLMEVRDGLLGVLGWGVGSRHLSIMSAVCCDCVRAALQGFE